VSTAAEEQNQENQDDEQGHGRDHFSGLRMQMQATAASLTQRSRAAKPTIGAYLR
jgi:hypothetical protein